VFLVQVSTLGTNYNLTSWTFTFKYEPCLTITSSISEITILYERKHLIIRYKPYVVYDLPSVTLNWQLIHNPILESILCSWYNLRVELITTLILTLINILRICSSPSSNNFPSRASASIVVVALKWVLTYISWHDIMPTTPIIEGI